MVAQPGQTLFDIAVQELGGIDAVFDLLDANDGLALDLSVPGGFVVTIPDKAVNRNIAQYFAENNIHPVSGIDQEAIVTQNDMNTIVQDVNYNLTGGDKEFQPVRLFFLRDLVTVQVNYSPLSSSEVVFSVDQSLDGENFSVLPEASFILEPEKTVHTFNIVGVLTNYLRARLQVPPGGSTGTLSKIIWKT